MKFSAIILQEEVEIRRLCHKSCFQMTKPVVTIIQKELTTIGQQKIIFLKKNGIFNQIEALKNLEISKCAMTLERSGRFLDLL